MSLNSAVRAFLFLIMGLVASGAQAQQEEAQARALLADAVDYYKEHGDKALAVFSRRGHRAHRPPAADADGDFSAAQVHQAD